MSTLDEPDQALLTLPDQRQVSPRTVAAWAMWDWGTQPFNTVITTFVFSVYITSAAFGDTNATSQALSLSTSLAGLFVALLAPVLGQSSDRSGHTLRNLRWMTWTLALLSASLFWVRPDPAYLWLGLILLAVGTVVSEIAGVNYNSLLDEVATGSTVGRVSGFGWGMGYLGGIIVLLVLFFGFISPEVGLFGVTGADSLDIRASMVVCGVWTMVFTLPTFLVLKERPARAPDRLELAAGQGGAIGRSWRRMITSYREVGLSIARLWRVSRHTVWFLLASALFRDGLAGVFAFGAVIAAGTFGFTSGQVIIFGAAANIVAGLSTMALGLLDDRLGPKKVIIGSLLALVILGTLVFVLHDRGPMVFWICGMAMTMFVGPAQSASRSFLARLIPQGRSGEIFGLYATCGRVASFLSPAAFGLAIGLGALLTGQQNTQYWGILGIVVVLLAGLVVMIPVKDAGDQRVAFVTGTEQPTDQR